MIYIILIITGSLTLMASLSIIYLFNRIDKLKNNNKPSKDDWRVK